MGESVFEVVKQSVTVREAAEMYGIAVGRGGMACCPFHDDRHPSMKVDTRFHCFGCGADGDVIDFTARLYNLAPREAAEKLAQDFGLAYDSQAPPRRRYIRQRSEGQKFRENRDHAFRVLADYYHLLRKWETDYSPKTPEENPHPRFMEAIQRKDYIGYLLDFFLEDGSEEQKLWLAEHQSEIANLERRVKLMADKPTNRERLQQITAGIEQGIKELFESEKYMRYLSVMSRFHRYSVNNTMLIYMQKPDATLVAGYNKWKNQFERHVKRGEHGITIIAPTPFKKKIEEQKLDPDTKAPILDAEGKAVMEEREVEIPMFRPVKVFDYAQTDGKPLPERVASPVANLTGSVENYEAFMEALRRSSPVPVEVKPLSADMDGYFSPKSQSITLREGMSEVQTVSAAVYEIAHAKLHNYGLQQAAERKVKSRNTEEVEAESISFMVCAYFGIETGANSFGYVATWSKNAELPEFRASLDTIGKTANGIITDVEKHFAEVCKERGIELPKDTEYELVTIPPSRADALAFAAEYAAFLRRDLNVPDSADRPTAEAVADRLLAGEDAELRKELEDFVKLADEIGIDDGSHGLLERFNGLFRQEWRAKEEPQPEIETETPNVVDELPPLPELEQGYPMPDTAVGFQEMYQYGYTDGNAMLPLTKERAMELFMQDVPVFLLYGDNTEAMALDAEDISSHTGVFGVEREEWDAVRGVVTLSEQADTEKLFLENPQDAFLIYQIRRGGELDAYRFMNYDYLQSKGVTPERGGYDAIYTGGFMDYGNARTNLDMIYQRFNVDHPADFKGHSLSVSDIVALKQNGVVSCHYVDSIGFRELPNFLKPENYLKNAEMAMEDDYGMIDGIINNGPKQSTVADLEAQVKAGFSISLTELAAASHREQKKPSVLEKLRERTPEQAKNKTAPKRSAEREL